ncbi:MAG: 4Fe-4S cluster-binding domain-containing protein [Lachnospiraceae bacterium]|nr:4Fe-4S cluster-binding domain-containing protein [Lachnospiraceae bacterium]MDY5521441.1 4Fe-4S cluster-binding domain-containing protein [Agathobacter sp.]
MKWENKGHELDKDADYIVRNFHNHNKGIYIFGAGLIGNDIRPVFEKYQCFKAYIDNDQDKQMHGVDTAKVFSLKEFITKRNQEDGIIIIAADKKNIPLIEVQLCEAGFEKDKDFYTYKKFMQYIFPILSVYEFNRTYVELAQICLTERCTLKCKACAHGCYAVDASNQDMSLDVAKESADNFFTYVDVAKEFVLIGGEPFLYHNLEEIIEYIGKRYRDKMIIFSITTNGTIIPKPAVLKLCYKYNILIRISNYSVKIPRLEKKYDQLVNVLNEAHVQYVLGEKERQWMDYGFQSVDRGKEEKELLSTFDKCKTPCREIRGSRYYYCVMARSVSDNLKFNIGEYDYLDLENIKKYDKKIFQEFELGYSEKGYLDMCNYCNGADAVNYPIPAAEQSV